jgi:predicted small lipoprotein YifL
MSHLTNQNARPLAAAAVLLLSATGCGQTGPLVLPGPPVGGTEAAAGPEQEPKAGETPTYQPDSAPAHVKPGDEDLKSKQDKSAPPLPEPGVDPR